jgi:hypothetical protein
LNGGRHNIDHARVGLLERKVRALSIQLDEAHKVIAEYESRLKSPAAETKKYRRLYQDALERSIDTQLEAATMSTIAQQKFFASLAAFARASADVLDELSHGGAPVEAAKPAEPAKPAAPKATKAAPVEPAKTPEVKAAPKPVEVKPAATPPTNGSADILAQCRSAAKSYAEVYGREGLKEVLKKYTEGTLADVPPEKLPELFKELS